MGVAITLVLVFSFSAGAFFIFIDKKERYFLGYGFTGLGMIAGLLWKVFAG